MSRINDKINEIKEFISDLESYVPSTFEEYTDDHKTKDACERCFEKIIEALADLAFLVIKEKEIETAQDDISAFNVLAEEEIISKELSERMKDAKGMRNILSHEYGKIDDSKIYHAIKEEIIKDAEDFIKSIEKRLK